VATRGIPEKTERSEHDESLRLEYRRPGGLV
jgi:hypothetical protein